MLKTFLFTVCISLCLVASAQQKPRKVVYIIVDGIAADVMEREDLPNFKKIMTAGSYCAYVCGRR